MLTDSSGEHQANDIPPDVDWAKLNEGREKLKLPKPEKKNETTRNGSKR